MSNSALTVSDVANLPEQRTAAFWTRAYDILSKCPRGQLETREDNGSFYKLTPSVCMTLPGSDQTHRYAIAAKVVSKSRSIRTNDKLYIIIDNNVANPQITFGKYTMDAPLSKPESNTEVSSEGAGSILDQINALISSTAENKEREKKRKIANLKYSVNDKMPLIIGIVVALAIVSGIAFGIYAWISHNSSENERKAQHARELMVSFDKENVVLSGSRIVPGKSMVVDTDSDALTYEVPGYDQINDHPREQSIQAGQCIRAGQLPDGYSLAATTNGPRDDVTATVNNLGGIALCALPNQYVDANSSAKTSYRVLLQMRPLSEAIQ